MLGGRVMGAAPAPGDDGPPKGFGGDPCMPSKTVFMAGLCETAGPAGDALGFSPHRNAQKPLSTCSAPDAYNCFACAFKGLAVDRNAQVIEAVLHSR